MNGQLVSSLITSRQPHRFTSERLCQCEKVICLFKSVCACGLRTLYVFISVTTAHLLIFRIAKRIAQTEFASSIGPSHSQRSPKHKTSKTVSCLCPCASLLQAFKSAWGERLLERLHFSASFLSPPCRIPATST